MHAVRLISVFRRLRAGLYSVPPSALHSDVLEFVTNSQNQISAILDSSQDEFKAGNIASAWSMLINAAAGIGYMQGVIAPNADKQDISVLLSTIGARGGAAKGKNAEDLREQAAKKLIAAAPNGRWPSRELFDREYEGIVQSVAGFSSTEYQRRKIVSREDVKATLPPIERRKH